MESLTFLNNGFFEALQALPSYVGTVGISIAPTKYNFNPNWVTIMQLISIFLLWLAWNNNPIFLQNKTKVVVQGKERASFFAAPMKSQFSSFVVFSLFALLSFSIFTINILNFIGKNIDYSLFLVTLGVISGYTLLKYVIYSLIIRYAFLNKSYNSLIIQSYFFINIIIGLLLFPVNLLLTYVNNFSIQTFAIYSGLIILVLYLLLISLRLFYIFLKDVASLFYLILYLCTLEILPVVVIFKYGLNSMT